MSMDDMIDLGKACGRKLSEAEAARLREKPAEPSGG